MSNDTLAPIIPIKQEHHPAMHPRRQTRKPRTPIDNLTILCLMLLCVTMLMLVSQCLRWDINPKPVYIPQSVIDKGVVR